jgi:hypothetical protein
MMAYEMNSFYRGAELSNAPQRNYCGTRMLFSHTMNVTITSVPLLNQNLQTINNDNNVNNNNIIRCQSLLKCLIAFKLFSFPD